MSRVIRQIIATTIISCIIIWKIPILLPLIYILATFATIVLIIFYIILFFPAPVARIIKDGKLQELRAGIPIALVSQSLILFFSISVGVVYLAYLYPILSIISLLIYLRLYEIEQWYLK